MAVATAAAAAAAAGDDDSDRRAATGGVMLLLCNDERETKQPGGWRATRPGSGGLLLYGERLYLTRGRGYRAMGCGLLLGCRLLRVLCQRERRPIHAHTVAPVWRAELICL